MNGPIIPHIYHFFTQAKFLENKIYTEKRVNYDKLHSKLPILRVNYDKLHSKLPIFCIKSFKIYIGQFFFTQTLSVVSVTYKRYALLYFWDTSLFPSYLTLVDCNSLNCPSAIDFEWVVWFHGLYVLSPILHLSNAILLIATVGLVLLPEMHSCWMSWMQSRKGGSRMCPAPETKSKCTCATCAYLMKQHKYTKWDAQILGFRVEIHKYINTFSFFIGPRSDHSLPMSVTHWLTD